MFISQYLPVNIRRCKPYIKSNGKTVYVDDLKEAYRLAVHDSDEIGERGIHKNPETGLYEIPNRDLIISAEEIYLAMQAYRVAEETKFSFFAINNKLGTPALFVSKLFNKSRLLVNAFNMQTLVVTHPLLLLNLANLTDKRIPTENAVDIFNLCYELQTGRATYLTSLLVWRDTPDAYMAVSPLMTPMSELVPSYGVDVLDELYKVVYGHEKETESFLVTPTGVVRKDLDYWPRMTYKHCKEILSTYQDLLEKKSNYEQLVDMDYEVRLYYSTNRRYLVNASTFQCVKVTNESVRKMLDTLRKNERNTYSDLRFAWEVAKSN